MLVLKRTCDGEDNACDESGLALNATANLRAALLPARLAPLSRYQTPAHPRPTLRYPVLCARALKHQFRVTWEHDTDLAPEKSVCDEDLAPKPTTWPR